PVIAVTANSLDGIHERYLESGMNDYILKPFEEHQLFSVMEKYLFINPDTPVATQQAKPIYNANYLHALGGDNKEFIAKMAEIFTRTAPAT
ncbi:hypothetical protein ABTC85_20610, partial [Acinetobacter baumannii]